MSEMRPPAGLQLYSLEELGHDGQLGTVDRIAELLYCWCAPQMEDAMCYAKDYKVYDERKKADKRKQYDPTLQAQESADDTERRAFFSEMKKREF